ncbi:D-alanyl-D-alanine carboxypeptidase family protein [Bacillus sp. FJAT-45350]|uniref:D-alanyl-D-alanine carboxypeptidase family protein n=1 Tax=Bacillus sp. FJAT-45350 TaxID=2011014 RepID=UPI0015CB4E65
MVTNLLLISPSQASANFDLEAESAILVDANTGKILFEKYADAMLPIASMTKMMSEYLILEAVHTGRIEWEQTVPISDFVRQLSLYTSLSNVPLRQDETYTVRELYESVAIYSANASTIAIAELIAGSETNFVKMMNDKAEELGLGEYEFVNTTGLNNKDLLGQHPGGTGPEAENKLTARATAKLAFYLVNDYPEVLETASIPTKVFKEGTEDAIDMLNWNWMLPGIVAQHDYQGMDGLKTGYTSQAGNAFTGTAVRNDMRLISVVMRTDSRDARFNETRKLLDYGFNNFSIQEIIPSGYQVEGYEVLEVTAGKEKEVSIKTEDSLSVLVRNGEEESYEPLLVLDSSILNDDGSLQAPVDANEVVGKVTLDYKGEQSYGYIVSDSSEEVSVVTEQAVDKANWFTRTMRAIGGFFSGIWSSASETVKGWF